MAANKLRERVGRKVLEKKILQHKKKRAVVTFESAKNILLAFNHVKNYMSPHFYTV